MFGNHLQYVSIYYSVEEYLLLKAHQCYTIRLSVFVFHVFSLVTGSTTFKKKALLTVHKMLISQSDIFIHRYNHLPYFCY